MEALEFQNSKIGFVIPVHKINPAHLCLSYDLIQINFSQNLQWEIAQFKFGERPILKASRTTGVQVLGQIKTLDIF